MAVQKIMIDDFVRQAKNAIVIDVRSPKEFEHAHIPGTYSLPLFNDEERAQVGTTYKQKSREAAIKLALPFFGKKMKGFVEQVENWVALFEKDHPGKKPTLIVHCWRGGMRSGAVSWLLDLYGFKVLQLIGGYKSYRNWVLSQFQQNYSLNVLGGYTGSGKTETLLALEKIKKNIIDLEGLAHHKGSAFGALGQAVQPSQEMFENKLAAALFAIKDNATSIWVEDESQRIGTVIVPTAFFQQMRNSVCYFLTIPFEERLQFILLHYGNFDKEALSNATLRIQKRLGGLETKNTIAFINEGNMEAAFKILLQYYDKWYKKNAEGSSLLPKFKVLPIEAEKVEPSENAKILSSII